MTCYGLPQPRLAARRNILNTSAPLPLTCGRQASCPPISVTWVVTFFPTCESKELFFSQMANKKVAFITGASSGIGLQVSKDLAAAGMTVVLAARRTEMLLAGVKEIEAKGGIAWAVTCDVTDSKSLADAFAFASDNCGGVDFVFANAGTEANMMGTPNESTEDETFQQLMHLNVAGVLSSLKHAVNAFRHRGGGTFCASSSIGAFQNVVGMTALTGMMGPLASSLIGYSASKAAVDQIVRTASGCYTTENISVYGLDFGSFDSEMLAKISAKMGGAPTGGFNPYYKESNGNPTDISKVIIALLDGRSKWKSGSNIVVDHDSTINASIFHEMYFDPGPPETLGQPTAGQLKPLLKTVSGEAYFPPVEMPLGMIPYLEATGIRATLTHAMKTVLLERPLDPKLRLVELLKGR